MLSDEQSDVWRVRSLSRMHQVLRNSRSLRIITRPGRVAEQADASDLKSEAPQGACGFESHLDQWRWRAPWKRGAFSRRRGRRNGLHSTNKHRTIPVSPPAKAAERPVAARSGIAAASRRWYVAVMRQWLLVLMMLSSLLVCPLQCMGRATVAVDGASVARDCCCAHCTEHSDVPSEPDAGGEGCDCICQGAVPTGAVPPLPLSLAAGWISADNARPPVYVAATGASRRGDAPSCWPPGRSIHVAIQSLQI